MVPKAICAGLADVTENRLLIVNVMPTPGAITLFSIVRGEYVRLNVLNVAGIEAPEGVRLVPWTIICFSVMRQGMPVRDSVG